MPGKQSPAPVKAMPAGWPVGSFTSYAEAQAAVDMLSDDGDFPVKDISIIGVDLMEVEKVVGRLSWGKVLGRGALSGAWMGLFIGLLISMFQTELVAPLVAGLAMGVVFGLVTAGVPYAMSRGTRDFATTTEIIANRYDVICAPDSARRARDLISRHRHNRR
ncbi:magnesium transporter [Corynebacterium sp. CCM 8862]|uniref:Magnesium transporter n=2 Tax=Corynebacterium mendelii TaxID=2765362 RepID=A0A939E0V1_9CORY|nr:magnesium transporter [Corynebacterium mendelii]